MIDESASSSWSLEMRKLNIQFHVLKRKQMIAVDQYTKTQNQNLYFIIVTQGWFKKKKKRLIWLSTHSLEAMLGAAACGRIGNLGHSDGLICLSPSNS